MGLTKEQQKAAFAPGSVAVTAGAGTGKTHMLAERYLYFLEQGYSPLQIVAVTFTEKAASELRSRIRQTITQQLPEQHDLLTELEAAQISTFHALAARICREHPEQAEVPYNFTIQDDIESPIWQIQAFTEALSQLPHHLFETIPLSLMREILFTLLSDPFTAEQALMRCQADWLPILEDARKQALDELLSHPLWSASKFVLDNYSAPGDKLDHIRLNALGAISDLEEHNEQKDSLTVLSDLKINVGSAKNWGGKDSLQEVKDAIKHLRQIVGKALELGLINLEPNDYDARMEAMLPLIREGYTLTREALKQAKYQQRFLDFNDLETQALQALESSEVQDYYSQRWQVFLIDEFQDTNPVQGLLLEKLTSNPNSNSAVLTLVGDAKQSIYGFRRADVRIFESWQKKIHPDNEQPVELSRSFRTHNSLIQQINQLFNPILGSLHQSLEAHRKETHSPSPSLQFFTVSLDDEFKDDKAINTNIEACRRIEAQKIADLIEDMLHSSMQIHDKNTNQYRAIQPKDIAILTRTWSPLEIYSNAIAARNIPILQAGGGNLLETREAKDAWTLLRFLADPSDSLSLAAILRSPFFALSDRLLYTFANSLPNQKNWWSCLQDNVQPDFLHPVNTLRKLLSAQRSEMPTRLLQMADQLTGYTAVIANLPGSSRRLADWNGFFELIRSLEQGNHDVFAVVRRLKLMAENDISIPRPILEGGNAVNLMTIHASKGLEWPVIIVSNLSQSQSSDSPKIRFDPDLGLSLKFEDSPGNYQKSALYTLIEQRNKKSDFEEMKRLLYVAVTRARDQLILSAATEKGGFLDILSHGLDGLVPQLLIPFDPAKSVPVELSGLTFSQTDQLNSFLLSSTNTGIFELDVTALNDYANCPLKFKFRYLEGHPGYYSGDLNYQYSLEVGRLTHKALELGLKAVDHLSSFAPDLPLTAIQEAQALSDKFRNLDVYSQYYNQTNLIWEHPISFRVGNLNLNGRIDIVGDDFILDIKTDREVNPSHHQFQLWAYQQATRKTKALLAYLRHNQVYQYEDHYLNNLTEHAEVLVSQISKGNYSPTPGPESCGICPYTEICDSKHIP